MTHSPESNFPSASDATAQRWWWRHEDAAGAEIAQAPRQEFASRSEAETWLGTEFEELQDSGVEAVTLFEGEREVYGPMSLAAG